MTSRDHVTWASLLALMIVGTWLRLRNLGELSLVADEGIQALAVGGVLEHGFPQLASGRVYLRSPIFIYLQALSSGLFGAGPFGLRLPSALFGVAVIPATYALGRTLVDRPAALLAAAIVALSVWEIELSRYARFYTMFQFTFLLSAICFFRGFVRDERLFKFLFLAASLITIPTHRISLVLTFLFVIPWLLAHFSWRRRLATLPWLAGLALMILYEQRLIRMLLVPAPSAASAVAGEESVASVTPELARTAWTTIRETFHLPDAATPDFGLFTGVLAVAPWALVFLAALLAGLTLYLLVRSDRGREAWGSLLLVLMLWTAFLHQFGIVLILLAVYVLLVTRSFSELRRPPLAVVLGGVACAFVSWILASQVLGISPIGRELAIELLGYPEFGAYFLDWYVRGWPVMTAGLIVGSAVMLRRFVHDRTDGVALFLLTTVWLLAVAASLFSTFREARYTFHLHPFVVLLFAYLSVLAGRRLLSRLALRSSSRRLAIAAGLVVLLLVNGDADALGAWGVGERTYQSEKNPLRSVLSWRPYATFHQDFESTGRFVAENRQPGDVVIAFGAVHMTALHAYYAGGLDYVVTPAEDPGYSGLNRGGVFYNELTGARNIAGIAALEGLLRRHGGSAWVLADRKLLVDENPFYSSSEKAFLRPLADRPGFLARDGETFARKLE